MIARVPSPKPLCAHAILPSSQMIIRRYRSLRRTPLRHGIGVRETFRPEKAGYTRGRFHSLGFRELEGVRRLHRPLQLFALQVKRLGEVLWNGDSVLHDFSILAQRGRLCDRSLRHL